MEEEHKSLKEKVDEAYRISKEVEEQHNKKKNKSWMPVWLGYKCRLGKNKAKRGYVIVQVIHENKNVDFVKCPIIDGTFKLTEKHGGTYHAVKDEDIFIYRNKPFLIQPISKLNPYNPLDGKNETYGQKHIIARMLNDVIKPKGMGGNWMWWIFILAIIGIAAYYFLK